MFVELPRWSLEVVDEEGDQVGDNSVDLDFVQLCQDKLTYEIGNVLVFM